MLKKLIFSLVILLSGSALLGCSPKKSDRRSQPPVEMIDLGEAPELLSTTWLNVSQPLSLSDLRGKVVLLDMWTFG